MAARREHAPERRLRGDLAKCSDQLRLHGLCKTAQQHGALRHRFAWWPDIGDAFKQIRGQCSQNSLRIVKDHPDGMAMAGAQPADAMAQINPVEPARPLHRSVMHSKSHRIALPQRNHFGARLHARPLFGQHELAAGEILPRL